MSRRMNMPWYRERWPWFLMAGPVAAVIGGVITVYYAVSTQDGLVTDDYYKEGLAINRQFARDEEAARLHLSASISKDASSGKILARMSGAPLPAVLHLILAHPTRMGLDRSLQLESGGDGVYSATLPALPDAHWRVVLEDESHSWRLAGQWSATAGELVLVPKPSR